jgi:hypothetical protein
VTRPQSQLTFSESQVTRSQSQPTFPESQVTRPQSQLTLPESQVTRSQSQPTSSASQVTPSQSQPTLPARQATRSQSQPTFPESQVTRSQGQPTFSAGQVTRSAGQRTFPASQRNQGRRPSTAWARRTELRRGWPAGSVSGGEVISAESLRTGPGRLEPRCERPGDLPPAPLTHRKCPLIVRQVEGTFREVGRLRRKVCPAGRWAAWRKQEKRTGGARRRTGMRGRWPAQTGPVHGLPAFLTTASGKSGTFAGLAEVGICRSPVRSRTRRPR